MIPAGTQVRVRGRQGVWTVVRDTPGELVIVRHAREQTSVPRAHLEPAKRGRK